MIYLDNSATTQVCEEAIQTSEHYMREEFFNASASYRPAVQVERKVNEVRSKLAAALNASQNEIVFTSGGTESNNLAILGTAALAKPNTKFITTTFEHPSVFEVFSALERSGRKIARIGVDSHGNINYDQLFDELTYDTAFVSIMHVNNEVGSVQDINRISAMIKQKSEQAVFHSDGVQAFSKLPITSMPADMYSISGHKFHSPKGIGALLIRSHVKSAGGQIGGGQERGMRSGTTNSPGIIAMGAAMPDGAMVERYGDYMMGCKIRLVEQLGSLQDVFINGPKVSEGAPHILNVSFMGVRGETLLHALEEKGIYLSIGSACSAKKAGKNAILEAIGLSAQRIDCAVRISLCRYNTMQEMDMAAEAIIETVTQLRKYQRR